MFSILKCLVYVVKEKVIYVRVFSVIFGLILNNSNYVLMLWFIKVLKMFDLIVDIWIKILKIKGMCFSGSCLDESCCWLFLDVGYGENLLDLMFFYLGLVVG